MVSGIPVVDLSKFTGGDAAKRAEFVDEIGRAFHEVGFVGVVNHGIPQDLVEKFYNLSYAFFKMDGDTKRRYEVPNLAGQRGYTSFGREHAKHTDVPDLKEFYQIGQEVTDGDPIKKEYPDNVHVTELADFTQSGLDLYRSFEESGAQLLRAISLFLKLPENYFEEHIHNGNSILRAIHYPPILQEPKSAIRAEQHEDINLITLLVGASAGGLQVLGKDNQWVDVKSDSNSIVVNVGDMLQRLTNNYLSSTTHRVVNPPRELWHTPRLSIPFFLHPRSDMDLTCLENCVNEAHPLAYLPISAGEYLDERLREIGLKK